MDCSLRPAKGAELLAGVTGFPWGSALFWTWASAHSKKNLLWLWPNFYFHARARLYVSPAFTCILKRTANYIATAWVRQQPCHLHRLRFSKLWEAWDVQQRSATQEQPELTCPWKGNDLPSPKQPSALIFPPGRGVLLPTYPSRKALPRPLS